MVVTSAQLPMHLLSLALVATLVWSPSNLHATGTLVSGRVVDDAGKAVSGALVDLVELHRATTTDRDGAFREPVQGIRQRTRDQRDLQGVGGDMVGGD